jgi:endonuclease YncB( thermonuclease family)
LIEGFVWRFPARVQRVYDGDTIYLVDIDQGYLTHRAAASVGNKFERVRVLYLWCPEIRSSDPDEKARGLAAKAFAETLLRPGRSSSSPHTSGIARSRARSDASSSSTTASAHRSTGAFSHVAARQRRR